MSTELENSIAGVVDSTGNVFADLELPSSEKDMLKIKIAHAITSTVRKRNLTQADAAKIVGELTMCSKPKPMPKPKPKPGKPKK